METWKRARIKYEQFVLTHPELVEQLETGFKWTTYFLTSRTKGSAVIAELAYCASNLLVLVNDFIFEHNLLSTKPDRSIPENQLKKLLAVLGCVEVFAEISIAKIVGNKGKWIFISLIQLVKTVCRLLLIVKYRVGVINSIAIPYLNRASFMDELKLLSKQKFPHSAQKSTDAEIAEQPKMSITLSSGRVLRTLASASGMANSPLSFPSFTPDELKKIAGELLYTTKPMAHLFSMGVFGEKSWLPWILAFSLDLASLQLIRRSVPKTIAEMNEVRQRTMFLLFYLLRSPFYDKISKAKIIGLLNCFKRKFAIGNIIWDPLRAYAEMWENMYFYSWDP